MCQSTVLRGTLGAVSHEGMLEDWRVAGLTPLPALRDTKQRVKGDSHKRHLIQMQGVKAVWPASARLSGLVRASCVMSRMGFRKGQGGVGATEEWRL